MSELSERVAPLLDGLRRHRREVSRETPGERDTRQHNRAWEVARALGSTKPAVVRAMLALVAADERPMPEGDPVPPKAPGARDVFKAPRAKASRADPNQESFW
jgi:hypothetical protein